MVSPNGMTFSTRQERRHTYPLYRIQLIMDAIIFYNLLSSYNLPCYSYEELAHDQMTMVFRNTPHKHVIPTAGHKLQPSIAGSQSISQYIST